MPEQYKQLVINPSLSAEENMDAYNITRETYNRLYAKLNEQERQYDGNMVFCEAVEVTGQPGEHHNYVSPNAEHVLGDQERAAIIARYTNNEKGFNPIKAAADQLREYFKSVSSDGARVRELSCSALRRLGMADRDDIGVNGQPIDLKQFKTAMTRMKDPAERALVVAELASMTKKKEYLPDD